MNTSESLAHIAPALVAAQADLSGITKDAANPHFRSKYASLDGIMAIVRPGLAKHGLAVVQGVTNPIETSGGTLHAVAVCTRLIHTSGEWMESRVIVPLAKLDPQGAGSAVTYGRRYALSALLALATEDDDDGESAMPPRTQTAVPRSVAARTASAPAPAAAPAAAGDPWRETPPNCPQCAGAMWDNRKRNAERVAEGKKAGPSYTCKDRDVCGGVVWSASGVDEARKAAPARKATPRTTADAPPAWDGPPPDESQLF